jgi:hypothetical protein
MAFYDSPGTFYDSGALYDDVAPPQPGRRPKLATVKLSLGNLTRDQLADKGDAIKTALTGNANFTTPNPSTAALGTAITALRTKIATINTTKAAYAAAVTDGDAAAATLAALLSQEAAYVQTTSGGDAVKIESAGMSVRSDGAPIHMTQVLDLAATEGDDAGEIDLVWKPVPGAASYEIQTTADPNTPTTWVLKDTAKKSKATMGGLPSGDRVWFRVRAVGANDKGGYSDAAGRIVP